MISGVRDYVKLGLRSKARSVVKVKRVWRGFGGGLEVLVVG